MFDGKDVKIILNDTNDYDFYKVQKSDLLFCNCSIYEEDNYPFALNIKKTYNESIVNLVTYLIYCCKLQYILSFERKF